MKYLFIALRPRQWIKNLFVFLPLIFGKKLFLCPINLKVAGAFFLFSIAASVVYLVNDIVDLEKDRLHPAKRLRPIASGKVSIKQAKFAAYMLSLLVIPISFLLNVSFGSIVVIYLIFNICYTKVLKNIVIIDIFCIGFFFLLRILVGCAVAEVAISHWIIFMSILLALFLGFIKRRHELRFLKKKANLHRQVLTKYTQQFIDQMISVVTSSIVVVYMLYTVDARTVREVGNDHLMYTIPFVYYGIFRYMYLVYKRRKGGDAASVLLSDSKMQATLALWGATCIAVIYFGL